MPQPPTPPSPRTADVWRAHPGYIGAWFCDLLLAGGLGLSAVLSDPERYSAPAYLFMRISPGGITAWGAALTLGAAFLVAGAATTARAYAAVLSGGTAVYLLLAIWTAASAATDRHAAWWGGIVFLVFAVWHTTQANEHRRSARQIIRDAEEQARAAQAEEAPPEPSGGEP